VDRRTFATWIKSLAERSGNADGSADLNMPSAVTVRPCVDGKQEAAALAAHLRAWRLAGIPAAETAVISSRTDTARALLSQAESDQAGLRVGELGTTDLQGVRALALVGCDHGFFAPSLTTYDSAEAQSPHEHARLVLRACAAPAEHLLLTWRGRPEAVFQPLAEVA
jgi:hypothetical protein